MTICMRMWVSLVVAGLLLASGSGCMHMDPYTGPGPAGMNGFPPGTNIPPTGTIPRELEKIPLPPYVIEAPDQLLINVITVTEEEDPETPAVPGKAKPKKMVTRPLPVQEVTGAFNVHVDGTVYLGVYGQVSVSGMTKEQATIALGYPRADLNPILNAPFWRYTWSSSVPYAVHWSDGKVSKVDSNHEAIKSITYTAY